MLMERDIFGGTNVPIALRQLRKSRRITLERLAELTGLSHTTWSRIERGEAELQRHHVELLVKALGVKPHEIDPAAPRDLDAPHQEILKLMDSMSPEDQLALIEVARRFAS